MIFHADSESDLKTTPNQVKNQILSKIRFLWYFDLKFPLRYLFKIRSLVRYVGRLRRRTVGITAAYGPPWLAAERGLLLLFPGSKKIRESHYFFSAPPFGTQYFNKISFFKFDKFPQSIDMLCIFIGGL